MELLMADNTRMKEIQGELKHISETLGLHHDQFMQMDQRFDKIDQQLQELHKLFLKSQKDSLAQPSTSIVSHSRSIKLDFPRFTDTPDEQKVVANWPSLSTAIQIQFGPSQFDNPRSDLFKLKQSSTVADYYASFTELANQSYGLDDYVLLDCFISGLIPELKREVISRAPHSILQAMSFAKLF